MAVSMTMSQVEENQRLFFAYARERHSIYLRREAGKAWPWTDDPILQKYRFTNVFRELDKTTLWLKENVREQLRNETEVLLAVVLFRWFNRIEVANVIFNQFCLLIKDNNSPMKFNTAWNQFAAIGDITAIKSALLSAFPNGPYVTGSYMITSPEGMSKLDGILRLCSDFWHNSNWRRTAEVMIEDGGRFTLQGFTRWLQQTPGQGPFLAYEVATDLRHTALLDHAPDINTWANIGPGCRRGLNRIHGRVRATAKGAKASHGAALSEAQALSEMGELLVLSWDSDCWPNHWPKWEIRDVEHTLCEYDKYNRVLLGEGAPRQLYRIQQ